MKTLLVFVFVLALAIGVGIHLHHQQGLVVIAFNGWRVDMPLWLAALGIVLIYVFFYYLSGFLASIIESGQSLKNYLFGYQRRQAKKLSEKGFMALTIGDYVKAERLLTKKANYSEFPWLNYMAAAKAAQAQGNLTKRDEYLAKAKLAMPKEEDAFLLAQSKFDFEEGRYQESLATLQALNQRSPQHPQVLLLLQKNYLALSDWESLGGIMPDLKRAHVLSPTALQALEATVWRELLIRAKQHQAYALADELWQKMPRALHQHADIVRVYAQMLKDNRKPVEAEVILRQAIERQWSEELVRVYGTLLHPSTHKQLALAEKWLKSHPESPALLLTLGRLCEQEELWGKAQRYLEASLSLHPNPETYAELGSLWERLDKPDLGAQYFKKGLLLANPIDELSKAGDYL